MYFTYSRSIIRFQLFTRIRMTIYVENLSWKRLQILRESESLWGRFCNWITSTENRLSIGWFGVLMIPTLLTSIEQNLQVRFVLSFVDLIVSLFVVLCLIDCSLVLIRFRVLKLSLCSLFRFRIGLVWFCVLFFLSYGFDVWFGYNLCINYRISY
jgi:hypothetical protein